ncbi:MAG: hypothetical protein HPY60_08285 [Candidatus Methanofastidiosum sp.]|nr:hypothetical protein [Candidatus Methanofastidiosa archaeon]NPV51173.1 hypothetical protein [Methanofastidiosum sp.]
MKDEFTTRKGKYDFFVGLFFLFLSLMITIILSFVYSYNGIYLEYGDKSYLLVVIPASICAIITYFSFRKIRAYWKEGKLEKEGKEILEKIIENLDKFKKFTILTQNSSIYHIISENNKIKNLPLLFPENFVKYHIDDIDERLSLLNDKCVYIDISIENISFLVDDFISMINSYTLLINCYSEYIDKNKINVDASIKKLYLETFRSPYNDYISEFNTLTTYILKKIGKSRTIPALKAPHIFYS